MVKLHILFQQRNGSTAIDTVGHYSQASALHKRVEKDSVATCKHQIKSKDLLSFMLVEVEVDNVGKESKVRVLDEAFNSPPAVVELNTVAKRQPAAKKAAKKAEEVEW